jgi:hypothetical protein
LSIREFYYTAHDFPTQASESVKRKIKHQKDNEKNGRANKEAVITNVPEAVRLQEIKLLEKLDLDKDYPEFWLTFLILSVPNVIGYGTRNSFSGGQHVANKQLLLPPGASALAGGDASSGSVPISAKCARERFQQYNKTNGNDNKGNGNGGSDGSSSSNDRLVIHEVKIQKQNVTKEDQMMGVIDKAIETLEKLAPSEENLENRNVQK